MPDARPVALYEVESEVADCLDLFHVLGIILAADIGPLDGVTRDALATVARLGQERARSAQSSIDGIGGAS